MQGQEGARVGKVQGSCQVLGIRKEQGSGRFKVLVGCKVRKEQGSGRFKVLVGCKDTVSHRKFTLFPVRKGVLMIC